MTKIIGEGLLHYVIQEKLGEGGMGVVYKADDTRLRRPVAIKFLPSTIAASAEERRRFEIEAQAAAALNHPGIATIHAIEEADDQVFIVMEYIRGRMLRDVIRDAETGQLPLETALDYAVQIAEALGTAHGHGILHRDIKSTNIMVTDHNRVKIMDFGLAKIQGQSHITRVGTTLGTVAYMAPEQALGEETDQRSDIWAFGVVLYEMLFDRLPFGGDHPQAVIYSILNRPPVPLADQRPDIPPLLEAIVNHCLAKDPRDRYSSLNEVLADLERVRRPGLDSRIVTAELTVPRGWPRRIRRRWVMPLSAVVLLALLAGMVLILEHWRRGGKGDGIPTESHLLVLPLTNIGGNPTGQAFCDGLMETLSSKLTQMERFNQALWVVPTSEVLRNKVDSPSGAYRTFGANLAITGSLQMMGKVIRLTLNLVDTRNLRQLNSTVIDVDRANVIDLQDQSVRQLLGMLNVELAPEARQVLKTESPRVPDAYQYCLEGRGYLQRYENTDNINAAIARFRKAIDLDQNYARAWAGLGEAYWRKYDAIKDASLVPMAHQACDRAVKLNDQLAPVNVTLGLIHAGTGEYKDAVTFFNRALDLDPTNAAAYRGLARAYEALKQLDRAEATYKRAINLKPDYWAGYNALGVFYYRHSRYQEAVTQFQQVVKLTPDNYRGYNNLGGMYYLLERWEEARKMFRHSFALRKSYSVASNLGTLNYIQGHYAEAARMYQEALKINDHDYVIWGNLGAARYWAPGQRDQAAAAFREAIRRARKQLEVNPRDAEVIAQLAGYYSMTGDDGRSLAMVEKSLALAPDNAAVMYQAGTTYEQLGQRVKAIHWIHAAIDNGYSRSEIEHQPELKDLLADQRFKTLVAAAEKPANK